MKQYKALELKLTYWSMDVITYSGGTLAITENGTTDFVVDANPGWIG